MISLTFRSLPLTFQVDPETLAVVAVNGAPLESGRLYLTLIDSYLMKSNPVLKAYADAHPERIPPDDSGRSPRGSSRLPGATR